LEQIGISEFHPGVFFPCHGMPGQKAAAGVLAESFSCLRQYLCFGAADVGEKSFWRERRPQVADQLHDRADRRSEKDDLAAADSVRGVDVSFVNSAFFARALEHRRPVAAHDPAPEATFLQGQSERAADEAGSDDRDLANCHGRIESFPFESLIH